MAVPLITVNTTSSDIAGIDTSSVSDAGLSGFEVPKGSLIMPGPTFKSNPWSVLCFGNRAGRYAVTPLKFRSSANDAEAVLTVTIL